VTRREKKQAKSFEAIVFDLASKLSRYIRFGEYKKDNQIISKCVYTVLGVDMEGHKDIFISLTDSAEIGMIVLLISKSSKRTASKSCQLVRISATTQAVCSWRPF
jgi:hypothetical protein